MKETCGIGPEVDGRERCKRILIKFKRLFCEVVSAKRFEWMAKEIELKVGLQPDVRHGFGPGSCRRGTLIVGGSRGVHHEGGDWSWRLLNKAHGLT